MIHAFTTKGKNKYPNAKAVKLKHRKIERSAGAAHQVKAAVKKHHRKKQLMTEAHAAKLRYISDNKEIATVNRSGRVTAVSAGKCNIYVFSVNGSYKKMTVTVK